jgi:hypothetical protein
LGPWQDKIFQRPPHLIGIVDEPLNHTSISLVAIALKQNWNRFDSVIWFPSAACAFGKICNIC